MGLARARAATGKTAATSGTRASSAAPETCRQCGGRGRGHPPRTTLTRDPLPRLVRGHETQVFAFDGAQKIRVRGGCPLPLPPPRGNEIRRSFVDMKLVHA